jgi:hypothetical protein
MYFVPIKDRLACNMHFVLKSCNYRNCFAPERPPPDAGSSMTFDDPENTFYKLSFFDNNIWNKVHTSIIITETRSTTQD